MREFVQEGLELFVAQSFSKNFGLYSEWAGPRVSKDVSNVTVSLDERVGQLCCVLSDFETVAVVRSQLKMFGRRMWSNCPNHGARIVATALNNPSLYQEW